MKSGEQTKDYPRKGIIREGKNRGQGLFSVFLSTDHKKIGTLYFALSILGGIIGVGLSLLLRLKLDGAAYGGHGSLSGGAAGFSFGSAHGLVMVLFMMLPALFGGFGNWLVPLMIGAGDMAFPRLNRAAFWLFAMAFVLFNLVVPVLPASCHTGLWAVVSLHGAAIAMLLSAVNFIVTIILMRGRGMTLSAMPPFVWSMLIASFLLVLSVPVGLAAINLLVGGAVSSASHLQIMLWFISHPEVYVMVLPAFGIISQIVTTFSKTPLYAQNAVVAAMAMLGLMGFVLWTGNMFHGSSRADMENYLLLSLPVIGLPAAFIVVSWVMTMLRGTVRATAPLLWAAGFIFILAAGGLSAFHLGLTAQKGMAPMALVAHFHYVWSLSVVFALFAGWYFWFPKMSGVEIRAFTGKLHFWVMFVAVNMIFLTLHFQGFDYAPHSAAAAISAFLDSARVATAGTIMAACSVGIFIYGLAEAVVRRKAAGDNPWGEGAVTPEWRLSSPPQKMDGADYPCH